MAPLQPPKLKQDATYQHFRDWRKTWDDYSTWFDLPSQPREKQLIMLRACFHISTQHVLEHTLQVPPSTDKTVSQVLDTLQAHLRSQCNEALRRRELMRCRQAEGESFQDFYVRLSQLAAEVDVCPGRSVQCHETQIKTLITLGIRDEELVRKVVALPNGSSLQEVIKTCESFEAASSASSAIRSSDTSKSCAVSAYKREKKKTPGKRSSHPPTDTSPSTLCKCCGRSHSAGKCPAVDATCHNCDRRGHYARTPKCPALNAQCRKCQRVGHYDKCCKSAQNSSQVSQHKQKKDPRKTSHSGCRLVRVPSTVSPSPVKVSVSHGTGTSHLRMLPDTGSDVTIIGKHHLQGLGISKSSLQPSPLTITLTADGSRMAPSLGTFQATLTLRGRSCAATVQVHEDVPTPLLSYGHCLELAIISADFPKQLQSVTYVNRCAELPLPASTSPSQAREYFLKEFSDVLVAKDELKSAPLKPMSGPPMRIPLKDGAVPFAIHTPRQVAFALQDSVKEELSSMQSQGIITPTGDVPSDWCHPMVVVPKQKGVRITVDLSKLNSQVRRPTHPSPTPFDAVRRVDSRAKYFTTADALCGYWQMELADEDQHLTTFITPYGRFQHCRGPMGFAATGDAFCLRGDKALQGIQRCVKVVDDILLYDEDFGQHLQRIRDVLTRCREHGITLNREKFTVAASSVKFCGYKISHDGIAADEDKVKAIRDFPTPSNLTDLRSFMGLVNQLTEFTPDIASTATDLRPLMSPKRTFLWTPDHDAAFLRTKNALVSPPVLAAFDPGTPVILQTDASRLNGLGYALLQDYGHGKQRKLRLVQCGSRFLTGAESRYSTIELELLATAWAMSKCKLYLLGLQHFTLMTDHRPLIPILNSYTLDAVENPRLQRLKEKLSPYLFTAEWQAGKLLYIPDALSRAPVSDPTPEDELLCASAASSLRTVVTINSVVSSTESPPQDADRTLRELSAAAHNDQGYTRLLKCVTEGFPTNRYDLHNSLLPYWKLRDLLSSDGNLVLYGARVVVPAALRRRTLTRLHDSHRGIEATKRRAKQTVFWPGIDSDIASTVRACEPCQVMQPSQQQEPYMCDDTPTRPFESVSADFFAVSGKDFLVIVDRLSGWPVVVPCTGDTTARTTCRAMCRYFREVGVPLRLRTDGGTQFTSREFQDCMERWGVDHIVSSPHYPQSNGHAEAAVKSVKNLILKTAPSGNLDVEDFDRGLLELRNSPNHTGRSPAQILYGHPLRSCVPAHPQSFKAEWQAKTEDCDRRAAAHDTAAQRNYDQHARPLPKLSVGQRVRIQDTTSHRWDKVGVVMGIGRSRDYSVRLPSGRVWWRNRRFLRPVPSPSGPPPTPSGPPSPPSGPSPPQTPVLPCSDQDRSFSNPPVPPRRSTRPKCPKITRDM